MYRGTTIKLILLTLLFFCLVSSAQADHTSLHTAATALSPGSWTTLSTTDFIVGGNNILLTPSGESDQYITQYTDDMLWDPVTRQMHFRGGSHKETTQPGQYRKHVRYVESTNTWNTVTDGGFQAHHAYDHYAIRSDCGRIYYREYSSTTVRIYNLTTPGWDGTITSIPAGNVQVAGGLEYFPDRNSLIFVDGDWGVWEFTFTAGSCTAGSWTQLANTNVQPANGLPNLGAAGSSMGSYHVIARYNRVHRVMLLGGGGSSNLYKMTAAGAFSTVTDTPATLNYGTTGGLLLTDPISGLYLLFSSDSSGVFYTLDISSGAGTWDQQVSGSEPTWFSVGPDGPTFGAACTPIATYGIIACIKWATGGGGGVYLYKHTASSAADLDFIQRTEAPGVIRWFSFDTSADATSCVGGTQGCWGSNYGLLPPSGTSDYTKAIIDTNVKAAGTGSLKFTIPSNSGADMAGSFHANFGYTNGTQQFSSGQSFYVSWRQRFSPCYLRTGADDTACLASSTPRAYSGGGGWKQSIINAGDPATCTSGATGTCASSCLSPEIVSQNTLHRGVPQMYHSCTGGDGAPAFAPFEEPFGGSDYRFQNGYSGVCPYSEISVGNATNCFQYHPNEWMAFQVGVTLGTFDGNSYPNSTVRQWIAREADTAWTLVQNYVADINPKNLIDTEPTNYGKVWLLPYNTGKSSGESHPEGYTWYDELIISTQEIAVPGFISSDSEAPNAPTNLQISLGAM